MGVHFDNVSAELSKLATEVLDTLEAEELAAGGFISDMEVKTGCRFLRPRIPRMMHGLLSKAMQKYQNATAGELVSMIDGLFREKQAEASGSNS